jgi:hypothetical protein
VEEGDGGGGGGGSHWHRERGSRGLGAAGSNRSTLGFESVELNVLWIKTGAHLDHFHGPVRQTYGSNRTTPIYTLGGAAPLHLAPWHFV